MLGKMSLQLRIDVSLFYLRIDVQFCHVSLPLPFQIFISVFSFCYYLFYFLVKQFTFCCDFTLIYPTQKVNYFSSFL